MNARPVLLIDGDAEWCARVCRFLEPHGISVMAAHDVHEALETIEHEGKPSAFVMNMEARRLGDRTVSTLRSHASLRDIPVGFVNKDAALESLLLMVVANATPQFAA